MAAQQKAYAVNGPTHQVYNTTCRTVRQHACCCSLFNQRSSLLLHVHIFLIHVRENFFSRHLHFLSVFSTQYVMHFVFMHKGNVANDATCTMTYIMGYVRRQCSCMGTSFPCLCVAHSGSPHSLSWCSTPELSDLKLFNLICRVSLHLTGRLVDSLNHIQDRYNNILVIIIWVEWGGGIKA